MSQRNGRQAEELARVMRLAQKQVVADVAVMRTNGILHTAESWLLDEWKSFRGSGKMASGKLKRFLDTCVETGGNVHGLGRMSGYGNELEVFYTYSA